MLRKEDRKNLLFGQKLRELRTNNSKLSQLGLSRELCFSKKRVCELENGKARPSEKELKRICEFFNVDTSYFETVEILLKKEQQEELTNDINEGDEEYKPKLPEMPEKLAIKGIRNIGCATLKQAVKDAKKLDYYSDAKAFVNNSFCVELCEVLDIDYPSYKANVLDYANASEKLDNLIRRARDFEKCEKIINNIEEMAKEYCEKINLDYNAYTEKLLNISNASYKLNAIIEKAKSNAEWRDAFIYAGTDKCYKLCDLINISYKLYKEKIISTCKKTSGEVVKMKNEIANKLYKKLDEFYLKNNRLGLSYYVNDTRDQIELFNIYSRLKIYFSITKNSITIYSNNKNRTRIENKDYKKINLHNEYIEVDSKKYFLY